MLLVVLDADLPWPRIHRGLHSTHYTRSLQALSTFWTREKGRREKSGFWGVSPAKPWSRALRIGTGWGEPTYAIGGWTIHWRIMDMMSQVCLTTPYFGI